MRRWPFAYDDGPFSDVELFCFVAEPDLDQSFEWVYGVGKAEINVLGRNDARWEAKEVDKDWAICKGAFLDAKRIFGDGEKRKRFHEIRRVVSFLKPVDQRRMRDMSFIASPAIPISLWYAQPARPERPRCRRL